MTLNLSYRIKRAFLGESGVVEKADPIDKEKLDTYDLDDFGNMPMNVTFRNPLGELATERSHTKLVPDNYPFVGQGRHFFKSYIEYKPGGNFP